MKSVSMYLRAAKTEAEDAGESVDGMAESVSELRDEILELTGQRVDIQIDSENFKSSYQILKELSRVWGDLTDITQANILELIGGKRNSNIVSALLENFEIAEKAVESAAESAGSALEENEKYLDSIQGKVSEFKAVVESFSNNLIDSELVKLIVELGTALLGILDTLAELNMLLPAIAAGWTAINVAKTSESLQLSAMEYAKANKAFVASVLSEKAAIKPLTDAYVKMDAARRADIDSMINQKIASRNLSKKQRNRAKELQDALKKQKKNAVDSMDDVGDKSSTLGAALKANWIGIAITAITSIYTIYQAYIRKQEEMVAAAHEAVDAYEEQSESIREYTTKIEELRKSLDSGNLSEEEAYEARKELLGIQDNIVDKLGKEAGAFNILRDEIEEVNAQLAEYERNSAEALLYKNGEVYDKAIKQAEAEYNRRISGGTHTITFASELAMESGDESRKRAIEDVKALFVEAFGEEHSLFTKEGDGQFFIQDATAQEYRDGLDLLSDGLRNLREEYENLGLDLDALLGTAGGIDEDIRNAMSAADDYIAKYQDSLNDYIQLMLVTEDEYASIWTNIVGAKEDYNEALAADDSAGMLRAANNIRSIGEAISELSTEGTEGLIRDYLEDLYDEILKASYDYQVVLNIKTEFETDDGLEDKVDFFLSKVGDDLTDVELGSIIQSIQAKRAADPDGWWGNLTEEESAVRSICILLEEAGLTEENMVDTMVALERVTRKVAEAAAEIDFSSEVEKLKTKTEEITKLTGILDDIKDAGGELSLDILNDIYENIPDAAGKIYDVASAQDAVNEALEDAKDEARDAYAIMTISNEEWTEKVLNSSSSLTSVLKAYYGADAQNWLNLANGKWEVDSTLVKNLSELWAEYSHLSTQDIEAQLAQYDAILATVNKSTAIKDGIGVYDEAAPLGGGKDLNPVNMEHYNKLKAVLELRKEIEEGFKDLYDNTLNSSKVEKYIADLDKYREILERITQLQISREKLQFKLDNTEDFYEQIALQRQIVESYEAEQSSLNELNNMRRQTIQDNLKTLEKYGVQATYNADANELWFENIEAIQNAKGADAEATNNLIKELEELYQDTVDLNAECQDSSATWWELEQSINDGGQNIIDILKAVVEISSEAVDSLQNVYETLHAAADEFAANDGFISVDTFQSIIELGPEYMQFLQNENGLLEITEERINALIAAKTRQLAIDTALSYVMQIEEALLSDSTEDLERLLYATQQTTGATWELVQAQLYALDLTDEQRAAALHNIQAIKDLAENAVYGIGKVTDSLETAQTAADDILNYVMDMLKDLNEQQIDAIEEQKDAFAEYIDQQKEALDNEKESADYKKSIAEKIKEIAKIQAKLDALALDDSREAQAERAALLEEQAALQEELGELQSDKSVELQTEALDEMQEAYEEEKDAEIEALEDSLSSQQKLYDAAMKHIEDNWDSLLDQLMEWNFTYGSELTETITNAWQSCLSKAKEYKDFVDLINAPDVGDSSGSGSTNNTVVGNASSLGEDGLLKDPNTMSLAEIIREMYRNSNTWHDDEKSRTALSNRNTALGNALKTNHNINAVRSDDGVWYIDHIGGTKLYDKYKQYCYHTGGIVGGGTIKENEQLALLKDNEWVLSEEMVKNLSLQIERIRALTRSLADYQQLFGSTSYFDAIRADASSLRELTPSPVTITFGDTIIHGANDDTVRKHVEVNRDMVNQIAKILKLKW